MAKHVFEISGPGYAYHRGEYLGETEKMFKVRARWQTHSGESRMKKDGSLVVECADPAAALERYEVARKSFAPQIAMLEDQLSKVRQAQKEASIAALKSGAA